MLDKIRKKLFELNKIRKELFKLNEKQVKIYHLLLNEITKFLKQETNLDFEISINSQNVVLRAEDEEGEYIYIILIIDTLEFSDMDDQTKTEKYKEKIKNIFKTLGLMWSNKMAKKERIFNFNFRRIGEIKKWDWV